MRKFNITLHSIYYGFAQVQGIAAETEEHAIKKAFDEVRENGQWVLHHIEEYQRESNMTFWYEFDRRHIWVLLKGVLNLIIVGKYHLTMVTGNNEDGC